MPEALNDVVIIGGGPAGLTSGLYLCRAGIDALLLDEQVTGGQAINSPTIENYPGFPEGISGYNLLNLFKTQAERFDLVIKTFSKVETLEIDNDIFRIKADEGEIYARSVIAATGRKPRIMGIPGEKEFIGRGVSYCATCDGPLFKGQPVMVIGGGDSAVEEALHLTCFSSKVFLVHRRDELRASSCIQERAFEDPRLEILWNTEILEARGKDKIKKAVIKNNVTGKKSEIEVSAIFFYVGNIPNTSFLPESVETDSEGYILTDETLETSVPGIYAAGDARANLFKQIITAAGEGALAAQSVQRYLERIGVKAAYKGDVS
jgi:thioredoxin reductase (NADPH)